MKDDSSLVEGDDHTNRESFHERESREEDEIGGEIMTLPVEKAQGNEASKHGNVEYPYATEGREAASSDSPRKSA